MKAAKLIELLSAHPDPDLDVEVEILDENHDFEVVRVSGLRVEVDIEGQTTRLVILL